MPGRLASSVNAHAIGSAASASRDGTTEWDAAATYLHHLNIGPGEPCVTEWRAAGLELPDLDAMRLYRLERVRRQLVIDGCDGVLVMDPLNIRYLTDTTNMQLWVMHNGARYAWVSAERVIVWDYTGCEFLSGHNRLIDEVRAATSHSYFLAGPRQIEASKRFVSELVDVIATDCGSGARVAIDQASYHAYRGFEEAGISIASGQALMERARAVKGPDELLAMRCAANACLTTMQEMRSTLEPGMTEREVWSLLHAGNIRRAGEWIETQILSSGPRTNPWFQEASSRRIEAGDLVAYDTDLVGAYGMMIDISRTWLAGDAKPTAAQHDVHAMAEEQLSRNIELLTPGRTFKELTFEAWSPSVERYRRYSCMFHGVGQCDEYPYIGFPEGWDDSGYDGVLETGMVLTVESFVGSREGGEGVKLENQVLVTDSVPENLTDTTLSLS